MPLNEEQRAAFNSEACQLVSEGMLKTDVIQQLWRCGDRQFFTKGYVGALNYFHMEELTSPARASHD